jgi:tetratricopeptide (TPR) repeat protein
MLLRQDIEEARRRVVAGDLDSADRIHAALALSHPLERPVIRLGIDLSRNRKDQRATLSLAQSASDRFPDDAGFLAALCQSLRELGRADEMDALLAQRPQSTVGSPQVQMQRGFVARDTGDHDQALAAFRAASNLLNARLEVLRELMALNRLDEAEAEFADGLARFPGARGLLRAGIDLAERRRQPIVVAERARHALAVCPEDNAFLAALVRAQLDLNEYGEARALLAELSPARLEQDRDLLIAQARLARASGDAASALLHMDKALALAPADLGLAMQRAWLLRGLGQLESAQQACRTILAEDASRIPAWICLADSVRDSGNREASLAVVEEARAACPGEPWFDIRCAEELRELDRSGEALELTTALLTRDSREELCLIHAELLADQVSVLAALAFFDTDIRPRFDTARAVSREANLLSRFGHAARAEELCRLGLAQFPADPELEGVLVRVLVGSGQAQAALAVAENMAARTPAETRRRERLRLVALEWTVDGDSALRSLEAEEFPDPEAVAMLARCYLRKGERPRLAALVATAAPAGAFRQQRGGMRTSIPGQLLNDSLCQRPLRADESAGDLMQKRALVRQCPDDTAAAIAFLSALPAAAGPEPGASTASIRDIPRRALIYWSSTEPPPDIADILATNREALSGFELCILNRESAFAYLEQAYSPETAHLLFRCSGEAQVSDLLRLAWLADGGGVYIDADDRVTRDIRPLLAEVDLVLYREDLGSIGNNFLAAAPGHPLIAAALEQALAHLRRADSELIWLATGPGLLTRVVATALADAVAWPTNLRVLQHMELRRNISIHCHAAYKSAGHWTRPVFGRPGPAAVTRPEPTVTPLDSAGRLVARLQRIGDLVEATRYLEIGVRDGARFNALQFPLCDGVDPDVDVVAIMRPNQTVRLFRTTSDAFWRGDEGGVYDLICLDGKRGFDAACRDFLASLRHAHARTAWLVTGTIPSDAIAALPDENRARAERERLGLPPGAWQGDVFRLVPFLARFMPYLDFGTITGFDEAHTLFWWDGAIPPPQSGGLESIARFGYADIADALAAFRPGSESDVLGRLAVSLRR